MPLPAALLERLKKRGIVSDESKLSETSSQPQKPEYHEEVIAEDYDEDVSDSDSGSRGKSPPSEPVSSFHGPASLFSKRSLPAVEGCPNKINVYHDCTDYCSLHFGHGKEVPSPRTERRYRNLIKRFPLPSEWQDVWEPGTGYYYFWNTKTDEVSWLPPSHPKAVITNSVNKMKSLLKEQTANKSPNESVSSGEEDSDDEESSESSEEELQVQTVSHHRVPDVKAKGNPNRRPVKRNDLDPMDPAAYSDVCPRGSWSQGLNRDKTSDPLD
jgi:polyglutamine-binding protein 1